MSFPTEPDFAVIKIGNGAVPTEVFTVLCGMDTINVNQTVNTNDKFRRDCAKPGATPKRAVRVTGSQWDITGSGVANLDQIALFKASLGIRRNFRVEFGIRDGTDAGQIIGYYQGPALMTAYNQSVGEDGTAEITLAGEDDIIWSGLASNPVVTLTATTPSSDTALVYEFVLSQPAPVGGLTLNYSVGGTALAADMASSSLPSGTIAVAAGATSATLTVALDDTATPGRTLILTLAAGTGYSVGTPSSATGTIA